MRNNKSLAAAITTALSFIPGIAVAVHEGSNQLDNVFGGLPAGVLTSDGLYKSIGVDNYYLPDSRFDFTGSQAIIEVPEKGLPLAAELFSSGNLIIPTPLAGQTTGNWMALVYTIDGELTADFSMTFTLDNGATFAENPFLGVRDLPLVGGAGFTVAPTSNTAASDNSYFMQTDTTISSLATDTVFRFDNGETLYHAYQTLDGTATSGATVTFYQVGKPGLPFTVAATPTKVYAGSGTVGTVTGGPVGTVGTTGPGTAGGTSLQVLDQSKFVVGWSYQCASGYGNTDLSSGPIGDFGNNQTVFKVTAKDTKTATTAPFTLTVQALSTIGVGGFNSAGAAGDGFGSTGGCAASDLIYRVHVKGDSVISVAATDTFTAGGIYQFDNLASILANKAVSTTAATGYQTALLSSQTTQYRVSAVNSTDKTITIAPYCPSGATCASTAGLGVPLQEGEALFNASIDLGDDWKNANTVSGVPLVASGAVGKNVATFSLKASSTVTATTNLNLRTNDQIMLLYKLGTANVLAEAGKSINMSVELKTPSLGLILNPARTVTVAKSVQAINAQLKSLEGGSVKIAVSTGSTQFIGQADGYASGYKDNYVAQIGQVAMTYATDDVFMEDGVTPFEFNGSTNGGKVTAKGTLTITGGQFEASTKLPGKATLHLVDEISGNYDANSALYTRDADGWTAVWNLDTTQLNKIAEAKFSTYSGAVAWVRVDGATQINTVENNPTAILEIDYDTTGYADVKKQNTFRKITKDGTVCTVYNVPPPTKGVMGADALSVRVTNDSAIPGKLSGKLYDQAGGDPIWTGDLTTDEVAVGATARFTSDDIAEISGVTWDGRAVLEITTILPKIEVMAMIRQNKVRMAPLSNLSAGAHGNSCAKD